MKHIKSVLSLTVICAVVSLLLALTNGVTAPIIKEQENAAANATLTVVLPNGEDFQLMDTAAYTLPESISEVYSEKNGGYVFKVTTSGYASGLVIMCGVDASGAVAGTAVIASSETLGVENTYGEKLLNATADTVDAVETVAGATRTSTAYRGAVKDSLNAAIILGGGSVDLRDEAQILADHLNAVLPAGEGEFTSLFFTEETTAVSAAWAAENGSGYVFLLGEQYIATDKDGAVLTQADDTVKAQVEADAQTLLAATLTDVDISAVADMPAQVQKLQKSSSGNYVFEVRAAGFGITGDEWYHPSGEYIYIKVSVTPSGKIIACETISQKETDGIGSNCANPEFYTQFNGKEEGNYTEIDAISGATKTTDAYLKAISAVFKAVKLLEGVA